MNKMNKAMPRTPFSTALSGSARMTELRLKNIFSGPKKRPPALFLAVMFAACIFCGNLVSCNVAETEPEGDPARLSAGQSGDVSLSDYTARAVTIDPDCPPQTEEEEWLLQALFQDADMLKPFQEPKARLMNFIQEGGYILGTAFVEDHLENTMILGVMDKETHELAGSVFRRDLHAGVLSTVTFRNYDGEYRLLYTFNGQENGQYTGQAGVVRLDGGFMAWEWPVEGDAGLVNEPPAGPAGAFHEYESFWDSHLALMAPGGVDIYTVNPDFVWGQEEPASMWRLEYDELFYAHPSSASTLPMPIYYQSLHWLNEFTNDPGGWRITSLTLDEEKCDPEGMVDCYTLQAKSWNGAEELAADLFFPYESEPPMRPQIYNAPSHGEILEHVSPSPDASQPDKDDDWDWDWVDKFDEEWEKEQEAKQAAEYQSVGVTMEGKDYYYQGQLVNIFLDQRPDKAVYTLNQNPAGTVNVKILRSPDGTITGAAYLTDAEAAELAELFEDTGEVETVSVKLDAVVAGKPIFLGEYTLSYGDKIQYDILAETGNRMQVFFARDGQEDVVYWSVNNLRQPDEELRCTADFTVGPPTVPGTYRLYLRALEGPLGNVAGSVTIVAAAGE